MKDKTKPCNLPCSKCGSIDVNRWFINKGTTEYVSFGYKDKIKENKYLKLEGDYSKATKDYIEHHCRCCQFNWQTETLKEQLQ